MVPPNTLLAVQLSLTTPRIPAIRFVDLFRAIIVDEQDGGSPKDFDDITGKPTYESKRRKKKAMLIDDGPRPKQAAVLASIWVLSGCFGLARYMQEQGMARPSFNRTLAVRPFVNSSEEVNVTRRTDVTMCTVWQTEHDLMDLATGALMVLLPVALGPVLAAVVEFTFQAHRQTRSCLAGR